MKVDLTPKISLVSGPSEPRVEKRDLRLSETKPIPRETHKETAPPVREVDNPQVTFNNFNVRLKFQIDKETGDRVIQIVDSETGEVVRQIPPQELLHVMKTLRDLKGLLFSTIS
jgi:flagellar protein FlaG